MEFVRCPDCQGLLPEEEIAAGWCEGCGKKLPPAVGSRSGRPTEPARRGPAWKEAGGFRGRLLRFLDSRSRWVLLLIGALLVGYGVGEYSLAWGTTADAAAVDLAALEAGQPLPQNHIRLGRHLCLYPATVYACDWDDRDSKDPKLEYSFYPIVSSENTILGGERTGEKLRVLVLTRRFGWLTEIPQAVVERPSVSGLVVNRVRSLDSQEANLLRQTWPGINLEQIVILEEDREPWSAPRSVGFVAGGLLLILLALVCFCLARGSVERTQAVPGRIPEASGGR